MKAQSNTVRIWASATPDDPASLIEAAYGVHIRTNQEPIAKHCLRELAAVSEDVAAIVEALALADRMQTRHRSRQWARRIQLEIPVFNTPVFSHPDTLAALLDAAGFLTGDAWDVSFVHRAGAPMRERYLQLGEDAPKYVVPYSRGLDSFAQSELLKFAHGNEAVWEVRSGKLQRGTDSPNASLTEVPRQFRAGHPREPSYRTRPLVYFSIAAIAAATSKASFIAIGENGQGAIGPSFARFSNEWPFRSAHPGFISRLEKFLSHALEGSFTFIQPQLWRTKGEVLAELRDNGLLGDWKSRDSCSSRPVQRRKFHGCGYCGGCLLRRTATLSAGLNDDIDVAMNLNSPHPEVNEHADKLEITPNEREIFSRSAMSMELFAGVVGRPDRDSQIHRIAREIAGPPEFVRSQLLSLAGRHGDEWRRLVHSLPAQAWLNQQFAQA